MSKAPKQITITLLNDSDKSSINIDHSSSEEEAVKNKTRSEIHMVGYNGEAFVDIITRINIALMKKSQMMGSGETRRSMVDDSLLFTQDANKKMRRGFSPRHRKTDNNPLERDLRIRPPDAIRYSSLSRKLNEKNKNKTPENQSLSPEERK
jgi:hypothetical protein